MMAHRPNLQKRKLILLGCEGKSERAYAALLNRFAREARLPVQIRSLSLEHAGDPLSRVKLLLKKSERETGNSSGWVFFWTLIKFKAHVPMKRAV